MYQVPTYLPSIPVYLIPSHLRCILVCVCVHEGVYFCGSRACVHVRWEAKTRIPLTRGIKEIYKKKNIGSPKSRPSGDDDRDDRLPGQRGTVYLGTL